MRAITEGSSISVTALSGAKGRIPIRRSGAPPQAIARPERLDNGRPGEANSPGKPRSTKPCNSPASADRRKSTTTVRRQQTVLAFQQPIYRREGSERNLDRGWPEAPSATAKAAAHQRAGLGRRQR